MACEAFGLVECLFALVWWIASCCEFRGFGVVFIGGLAGMGV